MLCTSFKTYVYHFSWFFLTIPTNLALCESAWQPPCYQEDGCSSASGFRFRRHLRLSQEKASFSPLVIWSLTVPPCLQFTMPPSCLRTSCIAKGVKCLFFSGVSIVLMDWLISWFGKLPSHDISLDCHWLLSWLSCRLWTFLCLGLFSIVGCLSLYSIHCRSADFYSWQIG